MGDLHKSLAVLGVGLVAACSEAAPTSTADTRVTYERDIRPLLEQNCTNCHKDGGIGPFVLDQWPTVEQQRELVVNAVSTGVMPPWTADSSCHPLRDVRELSDSAKALVVQWGKDGYVRGDPADYRPPSPIDRIDLGEPTRKLTSPEPYVPPSGVADEYRCFLTDGAFDAATYVTAMDIRPGNRKIVHHVQMHVIPASSVAEAEMVDLAAPGPGYPCVDVTAYNMFSWRPGSEAVSFGAGDAGLVDAGSRIVLQIHYNMEHLKPGEVPDADLTELALWTLPSGELPARIVRRNDLYVFPLDLPPVTPGIVVEHDWAEPWVSGIGPNQVLIPVEIIGQTPHMHALGTRLSVFKIDAAGGETCLIDVPRWDFGWQMDYAYAPDAAVPIAPGDRFRLRCEYDNQTTGQIAWGEGTSDEMCLNYVWLRYDRQAYLDARSQ